MVLVLYMMEVSPPCRAVLMTIKHLGIQAELREENIVIGIPKGHPEFMKINPRSCVPTIDDDGFYLWESRAIMTYLVNKYAPSNSVYPKDPKKRAVVDMMLNFDQGSLYRSQVEYLYPMIFRGETPDTTKEASYRNSLLYLEHSLEKSVYVAGKHLTLADLSILASISLAEVYDYSFRAFPHIAGWLKRMKSELPFYREVNEIPLMQFKFWYRPYMDYDDEDTTSKDDMARSTKM